MVAYSYFRKNYSVRSFFHITNVVFKPKPLLKQTMSVHFAERFYTLADVTSFIDSCKLLYYVALHCSKLFKSRKLRDKLVANIIAHNLHRQKVKKF